MTDEQFALLLREDLTPDGQTAYDEELEQRSGDDWVRARVEAEAERERLRANMAHSEKPGIAGWLSLPAIGLLVGPLIAAQTLIDGWSVVTDSGFPSLEDRFPGFAAFAEASLVIGFAWLAALIYVAVAFFRRQRSAPVLMICLLTANGVLVALDWSWSVSVLGSDHPSVEPQAAETIRAMLLATVGIPYFLRSQRVKNTFSPDP